MKNLEAILHSIANQTGKLAILLKYNLQPWEHCICLFHCSLWLQASACHLVRAALEPLPQDPHMCRELELKGECVEHNGCLCLCYSVAANDTQVEAAYFGELGYELQLYSPYIYYLNNLGKLRRTVGPRGSAAYNYFSPNHTELPSKRNNCQGTYVHNNPHRIPFDYHEWQPPPYKQHFKNDVFEFDKPLLVIHNKYASEWGDPPVNFIDVPTLLELASMLKPYFSLVYIRPQSHGRGYASDDNELLEFNDHKALKDRHPEVTFFHELLDQHPELDFNTAQLMLHANCDHFISVLGGNAVIASYFAGVNIIYAAKGHELEDVSEYGILYPHLAEDMQKAIIHRVPTYASLLEFAAQYYSPARLTV